MYDAATDQYVPISWADAFELVGRTLRALDSPNQAAFYTSGRLGNEATFLYQLLVREFGTNNLPDCSNMCHEATGRALSGGSGHRQGNRATSRTGRRRTALFIMGVNAASNAPRMLTALAEAYRRGAQIVHINPIVEAAATRTIVPHEMTEMAMFKATRPAHSTCSCGSAVTWRCSAGSPRRCSSGADRPARRSTTNSSSATRSGFEDYRALCEADPVGGDSSTVRTDRSDDPRAAEIYRDSDRTVIMAGVWG